MYYVYLIRSTTDPSQTYIGRTSNVKDRLLSHNSGKSLHTAKYRPWKLIVYMGFVDKQSAYEFEMYLKSGSGRSFAKKRLFRIVAT